VVLRRLLIPRIKVLRFDLFCHFRLARILRSERNSSLSGYIDGAARSVDLHRATKDCEFRSGRIRLHTDMARWLKLELLRAEVERKLIPRCLHQADVSGSLQQVHFRDRVAGRKPLKLRELDH
jgi:hypothetical protein